MSSISGNGGWGGGRGRWRWWLGFGWATLGRWQTVLSISFLLRVSLLGEAFYRMDWSPSKKQTRYIWKFLKKTIFFLQIHIHLLYVSAKFDSIIPSFTRVKKIVLLYVFVFFCILHMNIYIFMKCHMHVLHIYTHVYTFSDFLKCIKCILMKNIKGTLKPSHQKHFFANMQWIVCHFIDR